MRPDRWILALGFVAGGIACDGLVGVPDDVSETVEGGDAADAPVCPLDADRSNACHECRDEYCCGQYEACHGSSACGSYLDCLAPCTDQTCTLACIRANTEGHAVAAPYVACAVRNCAQFCGEPDAGSCLLCQEGSCGAPLFDCASDPDCDTLRVCVAACGGGNDACVQACRNAASSGAENLYNVLFSCGVGSCSHSCGSM